MKFNIRLDICTLCKLNCPTCNMRTSNYGKLKAGYTSFEKYKQFIDNNKNLIQRIEISNAGEPFLNPDIIDILKYSYENNIAITCKNATTLNFDDKKVLEAIVDYKVRFLRVAIDGITQDIYEKYRRNGNLELVLNNLKYILDYKKKTNSIYPETSVENIVWSNICKVAPEQGNPNNTLWEDQYSFAVKILNIEMEVLRPSITVLITGIEENKRWDSPLFKVFKELELIECYQNEELGIECSVEVYYNKQSEQFFLITGRPDSYGVTREFVNFQANHIISFIKKK